MGTTLESASPYIRACAVVVILCFAGSGVGAQTEPLVNVDGEGVGIHGYDPVVYFTEGKAVKGDPQFTSSYAGASYHFRSNDDKVAFEKDPAKYTPQYGGYCAMAMAMGKQEDADPNFFLVHDGKLLLQRNEPQSRGLCQTPSRLRLVRRHLTRPNLSRFDNGTIHIFQSCNKSQRREGGL